MQEKHRKWICLGLFLIAIFVCFTTGCGKKDYTTGDLEGYHYEETDEVTNYVKIVTNHDQVILVELYPEDAPITVENFQKLVSEHFYDDLIFHRVEKEFVIQGADPEGTGVGGSDETIKGEFSSNGVDNPIKHGKGVLSMARSDDPDSASSQFFICLSDNEGVQNLDGNYAAFGKVIAGMDSVLEIGNVKVNGSVPVQTQRMVSVTFVKVSENNG